MGEAPARVHLVGSPAIDGLVALPALEDDQWASFGSPRIIFLLHPAGQDPEIERALAQRALAICGAAAPTLALAPNHDPGREAIVAAIAAAGVPHREHLERATFVGLLRRANVLVGNSSRRLIEAAALDVFAVNLGQRQAGRQMPAHVIDLREWHFGDLEEALAHALRCRPRGGASPLRRRYVGGPHGDGAGVARPVGQRAVQAEYVLAAAGQPRFTVHGLRFTVYRPWHARCVRPLQASALVIARRLAPGDVNGIKSAPGRADHKIGTVPPSDRPRGRSSGWPNKLGDPAWAPPRKNSRPSSNPRSRA